MPELPLKFSVTCAVAVTSTFLSLVCITITGLSFLTMIDAVVNLNCLLLMTRYWKREFWFFCAPLLSCGAFAV